jgi:hypothetical protein
MKDRLSALCELIAYWTEKNNFRAYEYLKHAVSYLNTMDQNDDWRIRCGGKIAELATQMIGSIAPEPECFISIKDSVLLARIYHQLSLTYLYMQSSKNVRDLEGGEGKRNAESVQDKKRGTNQEKALEAAHKAVKWLEKPYKLKPQNYVQEYKQYFTCWDTIRLLIEESN